MHQWGAVTLFHGLPSDHVRAIAQDADGTLWFGTDGGLARFDGRRTQTVATTPVRALARDAAGTLWVGTETGVSRVVAGSLVPVEGTQGSAVTAIEFAEDGGVVFATAGGVVLRCPPALESRAVAVAGPSTDPKLSTGSSALALTSVATSDDRLLVGTLGRGLLVVRDGAVDEVVSRPRAFFVQALAVDAGGRLFVAAQSKVDDGGVYDASDLARPRRLPGGTGSVNALTFDADGDLWAATDERGAVRYHGGVEAEHVTFEGTGGGLRSDRVYAVFVDREGVVWFGTDRGVCRYDPRSPRVDALGDDADANFVRSVLRDRAGRTWCGTNRGLYVRAEAGPWRETPGLERRVVYALAELPDGTVLAGTGSAVFRIGVDGRGTALATDADETTGGVRAIRVVRGVAYVAVYGRGVARVDGVRLVHVWPSASDDPRRRDVVSLSADADGTMIIGTAVAGAVRFDGASVIPDAALAQFDEDAVWGAARDESGTLWIAAGHGLFAADETAVARIVEGVDARCVLAAGGVVWSGTTAGGAVAVRRTAEGALVSRVDTEHGLASNGVFAIAACPATAGAGPELLFGTSRGVVAYRPGELGPALRVVRAFGARPYDAAEVASGISLSYPQNGLTVEVAATSSRTFPEQFQYDFSVLAGDGRVVAHQLSHDAQLALRDLRPGSYRVEARAYSSDLVASDPVVASIRVERAPFPWGVAALSTLLGLALLALWWGGRQNRRLVVVNRELRETRHQLARETETERRRIARDLHDQTLADLRRLLLVADEEHAGGPLRSEIEGISAEIRRICEDLSPSVLANVGLTAALEWAIADAVAHLPVEQKFEYEFACDDAVEERLGLDSTDRIQIYRIVQEGVANVCRHAGARHARLSARLGDDGAFVVELEDDGSGFDAGLTRRDGRGLGNIRSRASMIGAEIAWSRREGGGTVFRLTVPAR
jgi:signal transduction histidine kinase/ligand-binding sensor domain-containing protein